MIVSESIEMCERIAGIRHKLEEYGRRWGAPATLIAATKTQNAEKINQLLPCGVTDIGENRVQEWLEKQDAVDPAFRLHIIGRLQTNKVKYIIERAVLIQAVDRSSLIEEIAKRAQAIHKAMPILIEVNIAGEESKAGLPPEEVLPFLRAYAGLEGVAISGLMTLLPRADTAEAVRPWCRNMRNLFEEIKRQHIEGIEMRHLSMGMSQDYEVAAQEGATMVRIGTSLFGERV